MADRSRIGFTTEPTTAVVDAWRVKLFRQAIGDTEPVADDASIPPTFLKAIEGEHFSSAQLLKLLDVPLRGVLHAEQRFEHFAPVRVGDAVEVRRRISDIHDKKDSALTFIVVDTDYRVGGRGVASSRQTIVVRNAVRP
jgi:hydroxyacyl-ACP dehydratase HTD2-like protein with hotdog domain